MNDFLEKLRVAMRYAIRNHPKAKHWARCNCEDNFAYACLSYARSAAFDVVVEDLDSLDRTTRRTARDWLNEYDEDKKLDAFVLTVCREMYKVLRA